MRNALLALIVVTFILGCGQKGPLYDPASKPAPKSPAKAASPKPASQPSVDSDEKRQTE